MRRCLSRALSGAPACRWDMPWQAEWARQWADSAAAAGGAAPHEKGSGDAAPAGGGGGAEGGGRTGKRRFLKRAERRKASGTYADELMPLLDSVPALKVPVIYDLADLVRPKDLPVDFGPLGDYTSGRVAWPELPLPPVPSPEDRSPNALQNGTDQRHPLSNKVEVTCRLKEVGQAVGLRDVGLRWIRALCGPRYTPGSDTLRLVSQRYYTRDDNRRDVLRIIYDLIEEGAKEQGGLDPAAPGAAYINAVLEARRRVSAQLAEGQAAGVEAQ